MSMTREEAIAYFEARGNYNPHDGTNREAEKLALAALRGPTREMVGRMRVYRSSTGKFLSPLWRAQNGRGRGHHGEKIGGDEKWERTAILNAGKSGTP